ncbi:MAG TPA: hypothetical protein VGS19_20440 [Streptosporangiaceae bacterium]|nr:hypothetical protein [Streptosporangiaceae bacterium]
MVLSAAVVAVVGPAAPATAAVTPSGSWGNAQLVPGMLALDGGGLARTQTVSCASAGNCAAGGYYQSKKGWQAFVTDEAGGVWHKAQEVAAALNLGGNAAVSSVSCGSAGNCVAGGSSQPKPAAPGSGTQVAFIVTQLHGVWGAAERVPGLAHLGSDQNSGVTSVSCTSAGNCAIGGSDHGEGFVADKKNGVWSRAEEVPGLGALSLDNAGVASVSCVSPGNCAAAGSYVAAFGGPIRGFTTDEVGGRWHTAREVPGTVVNAHGFAEVTSVSCAAAGNCAAVGNYGPASNTMQVFILNEVNGHWGTAREMPGSGALDHSHGAVDPSVSCARAGDCAAVGDYSTSSSIDQQAFVIDEKGGVWGQAQAVPGLAALNTQGYAEILSVSCAAPGDCAAGGDYLASGANQAFVVNETGGVWGQAQEVPGEAALNTGGVAQLSSVSCLPRGCAAVGSYTGSGGNAFVVSEAGSPRS